MMRQVGTCVVVEIGPHGGWRAFCLQCDGTSDGTGYPTDEVSVARWVSVHSRVHHEEAVERQDKAADILDRMLPA